MTQNALTGSVSSASTEKDLKSALRSLSSSSCTLAIAGKRERRAIFPNRVAAVAVKNEARVYRPNVAVPRTRPMMTLSAFCAR